MNLKQPVKEPVNLSRRRFLYLTAGGLTALAAGSYFYMNNEPMKRPPEKEGKILLDLHCHPGSYNKQEDLLELLSWGITALCATGHGKVFSYQQALNLPGVTEIDKDLFAKLEYKGNTGYFFKAQEIMNTHHILGIGCEGKGYVRTYDSEEKTIEEIKKQNGLAILPHPCLMNGTDEDEKWHIVKNKELQRVHDLCELVDEIEVFNATSTNMIPYLAWFKKANVMAKALAKTHGFKGIATSDAHWRLDQVKVAGIYIPYNPQELCMDAVKQYVKLGNFERHEKYLSRITILNEFI